MMTVDEFFAKANEKEVDANLIILMQEYDFKNSTLHLVVEDEDDFQFYSLWARTTYIGYKLFKYRMKGKTNVIEIFKRISWPKYLKGRILFFYDKDYDNLLEKELVKDSNVFSTSVYSIENYLVNDEVFKIIITQLFRCEDETLIQEAESKYRESHILYEFKMKLFTSWILLYRELDNSIELDKIPLSELFEIDDLTLYYKKYYKPELYTRIKRDLSILGRTKAQMRCNKVKYLLETETKADPSVFSYRKTMAYLRVVEQSSPAGNFIRGKFHLWFLINVGFNGLTSFFNKYNKIATSYNSVESNVEKKRIYTPIVNLKAENIFHIIPPKMKIPEEVESFLSYNYNSLHGNDTRDF